MLATTYNFIEKHNQLLAIDGRFKLDKQTVFAFQTLGTTSRNFFFDPDDGITRYRTGNGFGYSTVYSVSGRNWGWEFGGEGFTQDYRADVGFFQRPNSNFNFGFLRYNSDRNPKKKLVSCHVHNFTHINYDWQGRMYSMESEQMFELSLPRSSWFGMFWEPAWERLFDHEFGATREARPCNPFGRQQRDALYFLRAGQRTFFDRSTTCQPSSARTSTRRSNSTVRSRIAGDTLIWILEICRSIHG